MSQRGKGRGRGRGRGSNAVPQVGTDSVPRNHNQPSHPRDEGHNQRHSFDQHRVNNNLVQQYPAGGTGFQTSNERKVAQNTNANFHHQDPSVPSNHPSRGNSSNQSYSSAGTGRSQKNNSGGYATADNRTDSHESIQLPTIDTSLGALTINTSQDTITSGSGSSSNSPQSSPEPGKAPSNSCQLTPRPGFGTLGQKIQVITNYYQVKYRGGNIYHYDIEINPLDQVKRFGGNAGKNSKASKIEQELEKNVGKMKCKEVLNEFLKEKSLSSYNPVYDGVKNLYTSKPLPFQAKETFVIQLVVAGKTRKYALIIQPVKKSNGTNIISLEMDSSYEGQNQLLMAFSCIMNHRDVSCTQVNLGRSFYYLNQPNKVPLGEGLEIWFGYNQSIHRIQKGHALVINLAAKAFHMAGPAIDYVNDVLRRDVTRDARLKPYELKNLNSALKGLKVYSTHLNYKRRYVVASISRESAKELRLNFDGKQISVEQYFQIKYKPLRFPNLPCLQMKSTNNQTFIPLENCNVLEAQPKLQKILNGTLTAKMIKQTAIVPEERFRAINNSAKDVQKESGSTMRSYNLQMELAPIQVPARVLDPPALAYTEQSVANPDNRGVWRMEGKFKVSTNMDSWIILSFADVPFPALEKLADILSKTGRKVGLNFGKLLNILKFGRRDTSERVLCDAEKTKAKLAIIVLSRRDDFHNYDEIKFIADNKLGFITQCIDEKVLCRFNDQIATNLCLKINLKLGGVNHTLCKRPPILSKPVMIIGADAIHSPRGSGCPSIAAVVGSLDGHPSQYKVTCRVQENPDGNKISQEIILDMKNMVVILLKEFYQKTRGKYPEKILFFRDGVSEGQFELVKNKEVIAVQKACLEVMQIVVPITFIVVQKRHQTRMRPQNPRQGVGRGGNVPPGTTVDTDITHPEHFDYFLASHEGIQGTSKPAHYTVLHDDNGFNADELQKLSYHLCYTYGKCNRSISIPPPVMYADLACYRAKKYADFHLQQAREMGSSSSDSSVKLPDHVACAINSMHEFKNSMFFV